MVKQLSGFAVININGGHRIVYTYDEISDSGDIVSTNNKKSFYAVDDDTLTGIEKIVTAINKKMEEN